MSTALTVRLHLRRAWDSHFLAGATPYDLSVKRLKMACYRAGLVIVTEYREDYPAAGLSGVLITRMPKAVKVSGQGGLRNHRTAGL